MVLLVRLNFGATRRQRGIWITRAKLSAGKLPALSDAVATPLVPFATPRHELDPQPPATTGVLCPWARCASWRVQTLSNEPGLDQMAAPSVASQAQKCTSKFGIQDKSGCVFLLGGPQNGGVPFGFLLKQPQDRYPKKETTQTGLEMASFGTERPEAAHVQPCVYSQPWGSAQRRKHMSIGGVLNKGDRNLSAPKQRTSKPGSKPKPTKPKQATFPSKEPQDRIPPKEVPFVACDSSNRRSLAEDLDSKRFGFQALLEACELLAARWASFFLQKRFLLLSLLLSLLLLFSGFPPCFVRCCYCLFVSRLVSRAKTAVGIYNENQPPVRLHREQLDMCVGLLAIWRGHEFKNCFHGLKNA